MQVDDDLDTCEYDSAYLCSFSRRWKRELSKTCPYPSSDSDSACEVIFSIFCFLSNSQDSFHLRYHWTFSKVGGLLFSMFLYFRFFLRTGCHFHTPLRALARESTLLAILKSISRVHIFGDLSLASSRFRYFVPREFTFSAIWVLRVHAFGDLSIASLWFQRFESREFTLSAIWISRVHVFGDSYLASSRFRRFASPSRSKKATVLYFRSRLARFTVSIWLTLNTNLHYIPSCIHSTHLAINPTRDQRDLYWLISVVFFFSCSLHWGAASVCWRMLHCG